jgi:hypothetical protein
MFEDCKYKKTNRLYRLVRLMSSPFFIRLCIIGDFMLSLQQYETDDNHHEFVLLGFSRKYPCAKI